MSTDKALAFIDELSRNEGLQAEVKQVGPGGAEAVAALATRHGFECSAEEAGAVRAALEASLTSEGLISAELSDDDLESIAGGVGSIRGSQIDTGGVFADIADRMRQQGGRSIGGASTAEAGPKAGCGCADYGPGAAAPSWLSW